MGTQLQKIRAEIHSTAVSALMGALSPTVATVNQRGMITIEEGATYDELAIVLVRLREYDKTSNVLIKFALGDVWNDAGKRSERRYGVRDTILARIYGSNEEIIKAESKKLKQYGWVANKWPPAHRDFDRSWSYYKKGRYDEMEPDGKKKPSTLSIVNHRPMIYSVNPESDLVVERNKNGYELTVNGAKVIILAEMFIKEWREDQELQEAIRMDAQECVARMEMLKSL